MKYYLVTEDSNYADEFDLEAFALYSANSEDELKEKIFKNVVDNQYLDEDEEVEWPMEFYFGTNEAVTFDSKEELLASLGVSEITKLQYDTVKDLLGSKFGLSAVL